MATLKQIRQRIRTSKNIQQITRAMKLVAAARLTKAKQMVEESRPYAEKMREFVAGVGAAGDLPEHPLLDQRETIKRQILVLITADRGLAGSYNANVIRAAGDFLKAQGDIPTDIFSVGRKGEQFFGKRGVDIVDRHSVPSAGATFEDAEHVTEWITKRFVEGEADAIHVCYAKFYSPIRQEPQVVQVLPIEPPKQEASAEHSGEIEFSFEPGAKELLGLLLPKYLLTVVFQAMLESSASEHGARMTAMTNATDNAGKMIQELTLTANRARQAAITTEILEIVGGAEALND